MLQPYIECATALSDIYDKEIARISDFCLVAEVLLVSACVCFSREK